MGCGCVAQHQASLSAAAPRQRHFLHSLTDREFVRQLTPEELKDKKLLLAYRHLHEGRFERSPQLLELVRRRGVPQRYRWSVWRAVSEWSTLQKPGAWERLGKQRPEAKVVDSIAKDLDRTFPHVEDFGDERKQQLAGILEAFACLFPQVGYCQGMNFVAGFILRNSPDGSSEDSFFMLVQMMAKYQANLLFCDGLPLLKLYTFQFRTLLERLFPEVHRHFVQENITPELYVTKWFLTVFTQPLPFSVATRLWDLIVCDGLQALVHLALASVKLLRSRLLRQPTEGILELLSLKGDIGIKAGGALVRIALGLKMTGPCGPGLDGRLSKLTAAWIRECPEEAEQLRRSACELCAAKPSVASASWTAEDSPTGRFSREEASKFSISGRLKNLAGRSGARGRSGASPAGRAPPAVTGGIAGGIAGVNRGSPLLPSVPRGAEAAIAALADGASDDDDTSSEVAARGPRGVAAPGGFGVVRRSAQDSAAGGVRGRGIRPLHGLSGAALANAARYACSDGDALSGASGSPHIVGAEAKVEVKASMPSRKPAAMRLYRSEKDAIAASRDLPSSDRTAVSQHLRLSVGSTGSGRTRRLHSREILGGAGAPDGGAAGTVSESSSSAAHAGGACGGGCGLATPASSSSSAKVAAVCLGARAAKPSLRLPPAAARPDEVIGPLAVEGSPSVTSGISTEGSPPARQPDMIGAVVTPRGEARIGGYSRLMSPLREDYSPSSNPGGASTHGRGLPRVCIPAGSQYVDAQAAPAPMPPTVITQERGLIGGASAPCGTGSARRRDGSQARRSCRNATAPATARMPRQSCNLSRSNSSEQVGDADAPGSARVWPGEAHNRSHSPPQSDNPLEGSQVLSVTTRGSPREQGPPDAECTPDSNGDVVLNVGGDAGGGDPRDLEDTTPSGGGTCRSGGEVSAGEESSLSRSRGSEGGATATLKREAWVNGAASAAWDLSKPPDHEGGGDSPWTGPTQDMVQDDMDETARQLFIESAQTPEVPRRRSARREGSGHRRHVGR